MKYREKAKPTVDAICLNAPFSLSNGNGLEEADAGDYLVQDQHGYQFLLSRDEFEQQYEPIKTPGRKAKVAVEA